MRNKTEHTGEFKILRREPSSINGNPRFYCTLDSFPCYTAPDSSLGYEVQNLDGKRAYGVIGTHYGRPTLDQLRLTTAQSLANRTKGLAAFNLTAREKAEVIHTARNQYGTRYEFRDRSACFVRGASVEVLA